MKIFFACKSWSANHFYGPEKSSALLNIYYFRSIFQVILLGLKQFLLLFIKTGFTILLKINLYILEVSSLSYSLFDFSPIERRERTNFLERQHKIICFMFHNNFRWEHCGREWSAIAVSRREAWVYKISCLDSVISRHRKNYQPNIKVEKHFRVTINFY